MDAPLGTLDIYSRGGNDKLVIQTPQLRVPLKFVGGSGTDGLEFGANVSSISALEIDSSIESLQKKTFIKKLTFNASSGDDQIKVTSPSNGVVEIQSLSSTFSTIQIGTPTESLYINAGNGDDSFEMALGSADTAFPILVSIAGDQGEDSLTLSGFYKSLAIDVESA